LPRVLLLPRRCLFRPIHGRKYLSASCSRKDRRYKSASSRSNLRCFYHFTFLGWEQGEHRAHIRQCRRNLGLFEFPLLTAGVPTSQCSANRPQVSILGKSETLVAVSAGTAASLASPESSSASSWISSKDMHEGVERKAMLLVKCFGLFHLGFSHRNRQMGCFG